MGVKVRDFAPWLFAEAAARDRLVCACENVDHGHASIPCQRKATVIVVQHSYDTCDTDHPRLDEDGNITVPICSDCLDQCLDGCADFLRRIAQWRPFCMSCKSPLREVSDVMRRIVRL